MTMTSLLEQVGLNVSVLQTSTVVADCAEITHKPSNNIDTIISHAPYPRLFLCSLTHDKMLNKVCYYYAPAPIGRALSNAFV